MAHDKTSSNAGSLSTSSLPTLQRNESEELLHQVNHLMRCHWAEVSEIRTILQCTSSFFVLLYQRMLEPHQRSSFSSPKTPEQKLRNMELVLGKLQQRGYDVSGISAAKVVLQDEGHIRQLVRLFVEINRERQSPNHGCTALPPYPYTLHVSPHSVGGPFHSSSSAGRGDAACPHAAAPRAGSPPNSRSGISPAGLYQPIVYTNGEVPVTSAGADGERPTTFWPPRKAPQPGPSEHTSVDGDDPREAYVDRWRNEISMHLEPLPDSTTVEEGADAQWGTPSKLRAPVAAAGVPASAGSATHVATSRQRAAAAGPLKRGPQAVRRGAGKAVAPSAVPGCHPRRMSAATKTAKPKKLSETDQQRVSLLKGSAAGASASPPVVAEPPLSAAECRLLASHPHHFLDRAARDAKIERLRASRFLGDMQLLVRQRMRRDYDERMAAMRRALREAEVQARIRRLEDMRLVRETNEKYREAYAALMQAAVSAAHIPKYTMTKETAELADIYERTLREGQKMCGHLADERSRKERLEMKRYVDNTAAWQLSLGRLV